MADTLVFYKGKPALYLNSYLVNTQGISAEGVELLKNLHVLRLEVEEIMAGCNDAEHLHKCFETWTDIQYLLQDAWKFQRSVLYHMFWTVPKCSCPKMDNRDNYPYGYYTYDTSCPVHGTL